MAEMIEYIGNHDEEAKNRLITQYKESENIKKIITVYATQFQEIEDQTRALLYDRSIDTAVAYQLDQIGTILDQPRDGLIDDDYRLLLKAKIAEDISEGTIEDVIGIFRLLLRPDEILYNDFYPAGFELTAIGTTMPISSIDRLKQAINRAKPASVELVEIKIVNPSEFSFFDDPDPTGKGFRDINVAREPINAFVFGTLQPDGSGDLGPDGFGDATNPLIGGSFSYIEENDVSDDLYPNSGRFSSILV